MTPTRRQFILSLGAAGAGASLFGAGGLLQVADDVLPDPGWSPGLEERLTSACLVCPSRCGIRCRVVDGNLVGITGNPFHPMNRGGLCPRGLAGAQMLYHRDRITSPLVREGPRGAGGWRQITVEEAIELLAGRLGELRSTGHPESLALLAGYCRGSMKDVWSQFLHSFGSPNYVADEYDDGTGSITELVHGVRRIPGYDLERSDLVLSFGAPLFESGWSPLQAAVAFAGSENGNGRGRWIQVDTRFSRTAAHTQEWVGVNAGTHGVLALGIAYLLIRDQLYDASWVGEHVSGFEDYTDASGQLRAGYRSLVMRHYRSEDVSAATGVPVQRINALARALAESERPLTVCGADVMHAPRGLQAGLAVHSLNLLTGSVNRPGGFLIGDDPPLAPLVEPVLDEVALSGLARDRAGGAPPPLGTAGGAVRFAEALAHGDGGAGIEALMIYYANPLASSHPDIWQRTLERIPFVVSFSPFIDETALYADLVIPDLLPYERWQDAPTPPSYPYPVWSVARPVVAPAAGAAHTGNVVLAVARALGGSVASSLPYESFEEVLKRRAQGLFEAGRGMVFGTEFERMHHRQMEERGWWLPPSATFDAFWEELTERGGWTDLYYDHADRDRLSATPSGRAELMPAALLRELEDGSGLRLYVDISPTETPQEAYPLRLMPYRISTLASGTLHLERWLAEQPGIYPDVRWNPWVEINPATAEAFDLKNEDEVWVVSARARYRARVQIGPGTAPRQVVAPYGLRHPDGELANPLQLLDDTRDPLTGVPSWVSTSVTLERV